MANKIRLDADDVIKAGFWTEDNIASMYAAGFITAELGDTTDIDDATQDVEIEFGQTLPEEWKFVTLALQNLGDEDASPIFLGPIIAKTTTGFTVRLSANTDSANFKLVWIVAYTPAS